MIGLSGEHPGVSEGMKLIMHLLKVCFQDGYTFFFFSQNFVLEEFVFAWARC